MFEKYSLLIWKKILKFKYFDLRNSTIFILDFFIDATKEIASENKTVNDCGVKESNKNPSRAAAVAKKLRSNSKFGKL